MIICVYGLSEGCISRNGFIVIEWGGCQLTKLINTIDLLISLDQSIYVCVLDRGGFEQCNRSSLCDFDSWNTRKVSPIRVSVKQLTFCFVSSCVDRIYTWQSPSRSPPHPLLFLTDRLLNLPLIPSLFDSLLFFPPLLRNSFFSQSSLLLSFLTIFLFTPSHLFFLLHFTTSSLGCCVENLSTSREFFKALSLSPNFLF